MRIAFSTFHDHFERFLEYITIFQMVALAVVVLVAVSFRLAGYALVWYDEVAGIQLAWLTYYGGALATLKRAHIGVPGLINAMPLSIRMPLVVFAEIIFIAFFGLMGWLGYEVILILEGDVMVSLPAVPTALTQSVIPIGAVLFIIAQILSMPKALDDARHGVKHAPEDGVEI